MALPAFNPNSQTSDTLFQTQQQTQYNQVRDVMADQSAQQAQNVINQHALDMLAERASNVGKLAAKFQY
jgi:hypothetical protein